MFGHKLQELPLANISATLNKVDKKRLQWIVGSILLYAWAVHNTALKALNTIAQHTANTTKLTEQLATQLLDYVAFHPTATIHYWARDMVLKVHSNAS